MSQWTHILGSIRIMPLLTAKDFTSEMRREIRQILGKTRTIRKWNVPCTLPCGSEGSLRYIVQTVQDNIIIIPYGDLRDYENSKEVITWWKDLMLKLSKIEYCVVRDGFLKISVEGKEPILLNEYSDLSY